MLLHGCKWKFVSSAALFTCVHPPPFVGFWFYFLELVQKQSLLRLLPAHKPVSTSILVSLQILVVLLLYVRLGVEEIHGLDATKFTRIDSVRAARDLHPLQ